MELSRSRSLCLWIVSPYNGRIRKIRCSGSTIVGLGLGAALTTALFVAIATDHGRMQFARLQDALSLHRISKENSRLERINDTLRVEVADLRARTTKAKEYERDLKTQLDRLSEVVKAATSLGLVDGERLGKREQGSKASVGGAELDCEHEKCPSIEESSQFEVQESLSKSVEPNQELISAMQEYIQILRTIPLGVPGHGEISSHFGYRNSPFGSGLRMHEGLDVSMPSGSLIYSTADGEVEKVEYDPTYGLRVDVRHSEKVITRYAHLSKSLVMEGERVARGEVIALAGSSGHSTGPHLHYEVRVDGEARDPMRFLRLAKKLDKIVL